MILILDRGDFNVSAIQSLLYCLYIMVLFIVLVLVCCVCHAWWIVEKYCLINFGISNWLCMWTRWSKPWKFKTTHVYCKLYKEAFNMNRIFRTKVKLKQEIEYREIILQATDNMKRPSIIWLVLGFIRYNVIIEWNEVVEKVYLFANTKNTKNNKEYTWWNQPSELQIDWWCSLC